MFYIKRYFVFLLLCNFVYINADNVLLKGICFSKDLKSESIVFNVDLNISKKLFKKENNEDLFKQLSNSIKLSNDLFIAIKLISENNFKDFEIGKVDDVYNFLENFYFKDLYKDKEMKCQINRENIDTNEVYLKLLLIPKIKWRIENEDIINDKIVKDTKEFFYYYLKDNENYPLNSQELFISYKKNLYYHHSIQLNKVAFQIKSDKGFYDINGCVQNKGEIDNNYDIFESLDLTISFDGSCRIYKTNLNFYIDGEVKETVLVDAIYDLETFSLSNYRGFHCGTELFYHLRLRNEDYTLEKDTDSRNVNIKITNKSAIRYEIEFKGTLIQKHIIYSSDKLTERDIVKIIAISTPERYVLYENDIRVDGNRKLENEKYKMANSNICYEIKFTDENIEELYFYRKATFNELKNVYSSLKDGCLTRGDFLKEKIFDPNSVLEPGEYNYQGNNYDEFKKDRDTIRKLIKKSQNEKQGCCRCCC